MIYILYCMLALVWCATYISSRWRRQVWSIIFGLLWVRVHIISSIVNKPTWPSTYSCKACASTKQVRRHTPRRHDTTHLVLQPTTVQYAMLLWTCSYFGPGRTGPCFLGMSGLPCLASGLSIHLGMEKFLPTRLVQFSWVGFRVFVCHYCN
jgi:hypothetical protein